MLYSVRGYVLRLFRSSLSYRGSRLSHARTSYSDDNNQKDFAALYQKHKNKIIFNTLIEHDKLKQGHYQYFKNQVKLAKLTQRQEYEERSQPPLPVALQYFVEKEQLLEENKQEIVTTKQNKFQLPFATSTPFQNVEQVPDTDSTIKKDPKTTKDEFDQSDIDKWMINYEHFDDTQIEDSQDEVISEWHKRYGTPDPTAGITSVPCGGCGALLHCSDPAIPGYLPSEILKNANTSEMKGIECQRCHFLKEYNIALDVSVHPEEYEKLLQSIKNVKSLVVLMVDLLDFPCSIWPGIVDIIGTKRPVILVGNKVDLLPGDSIGYLKRIQEALMTEVNKTKLKDANIKHVALISAKTGYGIENLITAMFKVWLAKGDVFLVGCTNVGKSSLFNALLQSDYCKVHAVDIIKRATVSQWPGTTLNLLKFPINRTSGQKMYVRSQRLKADRRLMKIEKEIRVAHIEDKNTPEIPTLIGHIGRSFSDPRGFEEPEKIAAEKLNQIGLNERDPLYVNSKWLYDTPGVIHPDQCLSSLTTEELLLAVPKKLIRPQTFYLSPGTSLFIGGLARLDFVECTEKCRFTVFCSETLPITIVKTSDADEVYATFIGTELLGAPRGDGERLAHWPGLAAREELMWFTGEGPGRCCGDVVLSSAGWVAVTGKAGSACGVRGWAAGARGVHERRPALLPQAVALKGKRLQDTPAYLRGKVYVDDDYIKKQNLTK